MSKDRPILKIPNRLAQNEGKWRPYEKKTQAQFYADAEQAKVLSS